MSHSPEKYHEPFEEAGIYHIYNCTNNRERLFITDENCYFFLQRYFKYISPFAETYAYNLLPNHFHFICRIRSAEAITQYLNALDDADRLKIEKAFLNNPETLFSELIEAQFHRFFTSYSMAFNKMFKRRGNLFQRAFKRMRIKTDAQFLQTLVYVHANAVKHKLVKSLTAHPFTSYHEYLSNTPGNLNKAYAFDLLGGKERFIQFHETQTTYYYDDKDMLDE
jgi:putative transposase